MHKAPACVITQALSADFYFPVWHSYYGKEIGAENIFVLTDNVTKASFTKFILGGVYACPTKLYDEVVRVRMVGSLAQALLEAYDTVIVVDTDEFIVPDPRSFDGILDYLLKRSSLYVTSIGVDLVQLEIEPDLDPNRKILVEQRRFGYLSSSLCKTSITRMALQWGVGYHFCNNYPRFDDVFLFHLKRADRALQYRWLEHMSGFDIPTEAIQRYYRPEMNKIAAFHASLEGWPVKREWEGLQDPRFFSSYFKDINLDKYGVYRGKHFNTSTIFTLPEDFRGRF
jgi:hypothetical protein